MGGRQKLKQNLSGKQHNGCAESFENMRQKKTMREQLKRKKKTN